jgi:5'-deoxynucleotidase YfbR-like HD superfamily hydrolase
VKLFSIYEAGAVRRYHAKRVTVDQTVADHSWGVIVVLMWLYYPNLPPVKLFQLAAMHDVPEAVTGDIPAPAKWRSAALSEALTLLENEVLSEYGLTLDDYGNDPVLMFADNAELVMHCVSELRLGNRNFLQTYERGLDRMKEIALPESIQERGNILIRELGLYQSAIRGELGG